MIMPLHTLQDPSKIPANQFRMSEVEASLTDREHGERPSTAFCQNEYNRTPDLNPPPGTPVITHQSPVPHAANHPHIRVDPYPPPITHRQSRFASLASELVSRPASTAGRVGIAAATPQPSSAPAGRALSQSPRLCPRSPGPSPRVSRLASRVSHLRLG